ncbi:MAG: OmpA family protein [Puniceicoccaceae bacterium]
MERLLKILPLVAIILLAGGCKKKVPIDPEATVIGRPNNPNRGDFIAGDQPAPIIPGDLTGFGPDDQGLLQRGEGFDGPGERNVFSPVFFDFDQSFVRPQDRPTLDGVATQLSANPSHRLLIEGHCDWKGTTEYNLVLGEKRAGEVRDYLIALGIDPSRLATKSFGDQMAAPNAGPDQRAQDRRADLVLFR